MTRRLPAVWTILGQLARAEALVRSIPDPVRQARALTAVAGAIAASNPDRVRQFADRAETHARSINDPNEQAWALAEAAKAIAATSDLDRAETVARSITDPGYQAWALVEVARAMKASALLTRCTVRAATLRDSDVTCQDEPVGPDRRGAGPAWRRVTPARRARSAWRRPDSGPSRPSGPQMPAWNYRPVSGSADHGSGDLLRGHRIRAGEVPQR